ncbi:hypothetical protein NTE_01874 [Candidatus Nitrososphaera evergladensis SR1]|uniref:Uncharacterized protein n=1 Tax=Candidatus Nitrososphaera evergladensis SR1 TaxID=1459636 RepID=A0A075MXA5_9ARCH|nr:hypothetical protein NTE_01874 [Candidatus Nitrososphaera evergladensis SR1]
MLAPKYSSFFHNMLYIIIISRLVKCGLWIIGWYQKNNACAHQILWERKNLQMQRQKGSKMNGHCDTLNPLEGNSCVFYHLSAEFKEVHY